MTVWPVDVDGLQLVDCTGSNIVSQEGIEPSNPQISKTAA